MTGPDDFADVCSTRSEEPHLGEPPLPAAIALCVLVVCRARSAGRLGQGMVDECLLGTVWVQRWCSWCGQGGLDDYLAPSGGIYFLPSLSGRLPTF